MTNMEALFIISAVAMMFAGGFLAASITEYMGKGAAILLAVHTLAAVGFGIALGG